MTPSRLTPDDPRLTAYALGELPEAERAEVAAAVQADPTLQAAVAGIQALEGELRGAFAAEPIESIASAPVATVPDDPYRSRRLRFPYYLVSGLAAAGFAVAVWLQREPETVPGLGPIELTFATQPAPEAAASADASATGVATFEHAAPLAAPATPVAAFALRTAPAPVAEAEPGFVDVAKAARSRLVPVFDRAGFERVRAELVAGHRPVGLRIEDLLNHFRYSYRAPAGDHAVAADLEVAGAPWNDRHRLVRIGLRGRDDLVAGTGLTGAAVARNLRIEVTFNPQRVAAYRLIGYETAAGAGGAGEANAGTELAAGETVTALYEVVPAEPPGLEGAGDLLTVSVAYRAPSGGDERTLDVALADPGRDFSSASGEFRFAAAVAGFGLVLADSPFKGTATYDQVIAWAEAALAQAATPPEPERPAFVGLMRLARGGNNG